MAPLLILTIVTVAVRLSGLRTPDGARPWPVALRFGLAAMFLVTGTAHFVGMRDDMIAMVPPALPEPGLLVTMTGVLELLGAAGLLWRRTTGAAGAALTLLLIAMFPANVYAATHGLIAEWTDHLVPRTVLQVVFLAAAAVVALHHRPRAAVDPSRRGQRLGRALIDRAAEWAVDHGFTAMTLTTFADVAWNAPYYERLGFSVLAPEQLGDGLRRVREHEAALGLDRWPRVAMARPLS